MIVATVVAPYASRTLNSSQIEAAARALSAAGARQVHETEIEPGVAADLTFESLEPQAARNALLAQLGSVADVIVQPCAMRRQRLLIADMDSTMITIECIDELADFAGLKSQVAEVTEAAMRGELDFEQALDARVSLLRGLPETALARVYEERLTYTPGARALVQAMKADGARTILVSGGFTFFTQKVRTDLGFALDKSNSLEIEGGKLNGSVTKPIVTAQVKRATLQSEADRLGLPLTACLAVGDGANDIPMIETAGLGVAFRAKPKTKAAAAAHIDHTDLSALLFAQGYRLDDFRTWLD
jgi:phosphoserine phosphatase